MLRGDGLAASQKLTFFCCFFVGHGQFDMRLESGRKEDALVWALEALSDGTVVSGDSYGRVQVRITVVSNPEINRTARVPDSTCYVVARIVWYGMVW